ncbi:hypothetical protein COL5a_000741 [Colletotrichum fioriniae]|nr:hypothetical protein COL5a_000741 [Colletotrichum fioriniae]
MGASDSKLVFKKGIFRLSEERHIPADDPYWTSFWELPESSEDIFSLFAPADIRRTRDKALENLETLILALTSRLFILRHHPSFPDPEIAPERDALNCVRVLTRILPFIYEADNLAAWEERFFWGARRKRTRQSAIAAEVLFDGAQEGQKPPKNENEDFEDAKPLAEELIDTLVDLLFFSDLTLPRQPSGRPKVSYAIWQSGVGCNTSVATTKEFESNRSEILRLLLTMTSQSMYMSSNVLPQRGIRALTHICTCPDKQVVLSVLCSLLNTTLKYNPATWRVPYNTLVFKDEKQILVTYTLQLLLVFLLYPIPEQNGTTPKNYYRHFLGRLHRPQDFQFIVDGMTRILNQPLHEKSSYLPSGQTNARFAPEIIMLFWEITQCNKRFRSFIIDTERVHDFVVLTLFYALEYKNDASKQGVVRMCAFLLQTLSVEKNFGTNLNRRFEGQDSLPLTIRIPGFSGTHADFLIHNPELVFAILRNKKRIEALRTFTLESGQEEIERRNRRRKESAANGDGLEPSSVRSSAESIRSPTTSHPRPPTLSDVPEEDGTFAIGDDEDDSEDEDHRPTPAQSTTSENPSVASSQASVVEDAVPTQLRGMSEKARGKMPAGMSNFSRQNSTTSLGGYSASGQSQSGGFEPTANWIESWLPELPLHTILTVIQQVTALLPRQALAGESANRETLLKIQEIKLEKYDWREQETAFNNQLPQFRTAITPPGSSSPVRLHFIHVRSSHSNAIPLLLIPPFPFTNLSLGHLIQPLTEPGSSTTDGEQQQQPFHVVIPSLPGLGFSDALPSNDASVIPTTTDLLNTLMTRLSYPHYLVSNTASAASSPAQIDWKLADNLARHHPSSCLGAHFISPSLAAPTLKDAPLEWMKWSLAKFFHAPILGYQSEDLRSLDEETHASHILAGGRRSLPTSLQAGAGSTLVEPNTTSFALCDSPVGLLALVLKVIRVLGAKKEFSAAEIITFTQTAWLPGPEAAMRLWARCLTHHETTPPLSKPTKKPNVAITVFSGAGEAVEVSGGRRIADDDLEAQTQPRNDVVDTVSPQPAPNPYVCPAWANVSYNAVHIRRVPIPGGRPGLVAWDHPELIGDGVRGLAANLLSFDARLQDIVARQQQRPETVPLQGVVVQSDSSASTAATGSGQGVAISAAPVLPSTPQVEATKWRLSQIREASETPKKSLQLDDGDAGMMLSPPDVDFAGASPDTIVVTPPVDMK